MLSEQEVLAIVQRKFPSCNWTLDESDAATIAVLASIQSPGCPMELEVVYYRQYNAARIYVAIGKVSKMYLFTTPHRQDVTLDNALERLKQWFVEFSGCLSEVVK